MLRRHLCAITSLVNGLMASDVGLIDENEIPTELKDVFEMFLMAKNHTFTN